MAVNSRTVGTGKQHATLQAWWTYAAAQTSPWQQASCYGDVGPLSITTLPSAWRGTMTATSHPIITAASQQSWQYIYTTPATNVTFAAATCARLQSTADGTGAIQVDLTGDSLTLAQSLGNWLEITDLLIDAPDSTDTRYGILAVDAGGVLIKRNLVRLGLNSTGATHLGIGLASDANGLTSVANSVIANNFLFSTSAATTVEFPMITVTEEGGGQEARREGIKPYQTIIAHNTVSGGYWGIEWNDFADEMRFRILNNIVVGQTSKSLGWHDIGNYFGRELEMSGNVVSDATGDFGHLTDNSGTPATMPPSEWRKRVTQSGNRLGCGTSQFTSNTLVPTTTSNALGAGRAISELPTDAMGTTYPTDTFCDAGAYQSANNYADDERQYH